MTAPPVVAVGDILLRIEAGRSAKTKERPAQPGELGILKVSAVTWGAFRPEENKAILDDYEPGECPRPMHGDILISRANTRELVGAPVIVDGDHPDLLLSDKILRLVPDDSRVDRRYLARALRSAASRAHFEGRAGGTSGSMTNITQDDIRGAPLPLPPLAEQRRIADILDKADAIRRKRQEALALTEELLHSAFLEMVGPAAASCESWPVCSIESLAAKVPNAMRTGPFGSDLLHSEFVDEGVAVLGIDNAVQNRFTWVERRFITPEKYESLRRYKVHPGDVIVTIMGTTGRSAVIPEDIPPAITTKHLATITLDRDEAEPEFVSQALFRHPAVLQQIAAANRGAIMSGLNLGLIKALKLPIPPRERQREFAIATARIRAIHARMEANELEEELFNSLVARAFSGRLASTEQPC